MRFTEDQRAAIAHGDGHLQLIACAGSGKTEVVARRVARLLDPAAPNPLHPSGIVAFTFTDKAAAELKARIAARVHEAHGPLPGLAAMFVGTIHGYCLELLRREVPAFLGYAVLDEVAQRMLVERHPERSGRACTTTLWGDPLAPWKDTGVYLNTLDVLRQAEVDPAKLDGCTALDGLRAWRELLEDRKRLDYTAIMEHAVRVLAEDSGVRARLARSLRHVIVDEYQDVNPMQERVVRALAELGAWLCVVGDDDQSIYQWNGASVANILEFATRYPGVRAIRLQENFRSSRAVVTLARDFVAQNRERLAKDMVATDAQLAEPGDVSARRFADVRAEAAWIAERFAGLRGAVIRERDGARGIAWSDMAVLIRSDLRRNAREILAAFEARGIPYVVTGLNNLFETAEAKASADLARFVAGGDLSGGDLAARWRDADLGLIEDSIREALRYAEAVRDEVVWADHEAPELLPQRVLLEFLGRLGVCEEAVPGAPGRGQAVVANLGVFSSLLGDFEAIHHHGTFAARYAQLVAFLDNAAKDHYAEGLLGESLAAPDAVRVTTIHKAKGLEWPVVAIPGLVDGRFPSRVSNQDPRKKKRRDWWDLIPMDAVAGGDRYRGTLDDERRLFYVAITRAQKWLLLSFAPSPEFSWLNRPSPFLQWAERHPAVAARGPEATPQRAEPTARRGVANVVLDFTTMKSLFECPQRFRLQTLYGFAPPPDPAQGFGASIHDALAAVHRRALAGESVTMDDVPGLLTDHLRLPYAPPGLFEQRREYAARILTTYLARHGGSLDRVEFVEQPVELPMGDGVTVVGRIDLVRRRDDGSVSIVDFKSSAHAQGELQTQAQLHLYALGYRALTGRDARAVEVWELDHDTRDARPVDDAMLDAVCAQAAEAAAMLREGRFPPNPDAERCGRCAMRGLCAAGASALAGDGGDAVASG